MKTATLLACTTIALFPLTSRAVTLLPGQSATPDLLSTTNLTSIYPSHDPLSILDPTTNNPNGGYVPDVLQDPSTHTFTYALDVFFSGNLPLTAISFPGYKGYDVNAGFASSTYTPLTVSRSADGDTITFNFTGTTNNTSSSFELLLQTNATTLAYNPGTFTFSQNNTTFTSSAYMTSPAPFIANPVPEPTTALLLPLSLLALHLRRSRT